MATLSIPPNNAVLQRASNLKIRVESHTGVFVSARDGEAHCSNYALSILDTFAQPVSYGETVAAMGEDVSGAQEWIDRMTTIRMLYHIGALVDIQNPGHLRGRNQQDFDDPRIHVRMLNDRTRTSAYIAALREVIRPGKDVVIDVGTGSGVLALAAAQAGARHVYAVEVGNVATVAEKIFTANGVADRVTVVKGWSTQVKLPEKADLLVTETIGDHPLGEQILEIILDARKRLLVPNARIIPLVLDIYGLPLQLPDDQRPRQAIGEAAISKWKEWYGIDFSPLQAYSTSEIPRSLRVRYEKVKEWQAVAPPMHLARVDFQTFIDTMIEAEVTFKMIKEGVLDGVLIYFDLQLSPSASITTRPESVGKDNHWFGHVWLLPSPQPILPGDTFTATYRYRVPGHSNGVEAVRKVS